MDYEVGWVSDFFFFLGVKFNLKCIVPHNIIKSHIIFLLAT
jgi:hypothetical protein